MAEVPGSVNERLCLDFGMLLMISVIRMRRVAGRGGRHTPEPCDRALPSKLMPAIAFAPQQFYEAFGHLCVPEIPGREWSPLERFRAYESPDQFCRKPQAASGRNDSHSDG